MVGGRAFLLALVFVFTAGTQAIAQTMTAPDITSEGPFLLDEGETAGVSIDGNSLTLNGGRIRDGANNDAVLTHDGLAADAGHKVDGVKPALAANRGAAVDASSLALTYGEALDEGSRPAPGDFTVQVDGTARSVSGVSVSGSVVILTLNPAVEHGATGIRVSYTPGANPILDAVGNDALGLSSRSGTNTTGAPNTDPQITSPSSFDRCQLPFRRSCSDRSLLVFASLPPDV